MNRGEGEGEAESERRVERGRGEKSGEKSGERDISPSINMLASCREVGSPAPHGRAGELTATRW